MDHPTVALLLHALPVPAAVTDLDLRIIQVNDAGRAMLGLPADAGSASVGEPLPSAVPAADRNSFGAAADTLRSLQSPGVAHPTVSFEVQRQTVHGERPCHITATMLTRDGGTAGGFLFSTRDMGAMPDTARLAEQEAARMEVARQLAATMNHEINNPLFVVSATLEDLLAEIDDPAEERRLSAALDAVWKVSSAVKKLSEIRQLVTTAYIDGFPMIDLEASQVHPDES